MSSRETASTNSDSEDEPRISNHTALILENIMNILVALPDSTKDIRSKRKKAAAVKKRVEREESNQDKKFRASSNKANEAQRKLGKISQELQDGAKSIKRGSGPATPEADRLSPEREFAHIMQEHAKKELARVEKHECDEGLVELKDYIQGLGFKDLNIPRKTSHRPLTSKELRPTNHNDSIMVSAVFSIYIFKDKH